MWSCPHRLALRRRSDSSPIHHLGNAGQYQLRPLSCPPGIMSATGRNGTNTMGVARKTNSPLGRLSEESAEPRRRKRPRTFDHPRCKNAPRKRRECAIRRGLDAIYTIHDTQEESFVPHPGRIAAWRSTHGLTVRLSPGHLDGADAHKRLSLLEMVARGGVEPPTRGFSVPFRKQIKPLKTLGFLRRTSGIISAVTCG